MEAVQIVECPRDAWQGLSHIIPTEIKIAYLTELIQVGFHTLDAGSFVSPKAVPQMQDTAVVLEALPYAAYPNTGILVIVANRRGVEEAVRHPAVRYVGYPLSLSETFQRQNTRQSRAEAQAFVDELVELCRAHGKVPVVYLSMGFGNPYGDPYDPEEVVAIARNLQAKGVPILSLADTVGLATPDQVYALLEKVLRFVEGVTWGVHLHATPQNSREKIAAAWEAGCRRFDTALGGYGGCPFAGVPLVSNLRTETLLSFLEEKSALPPLDWQALARAQSLLSQAFG